MDVVFLVNLFRLNLKIESKFSHNCAAKNLFLSSCYHWDGKISLREVDQKVSHGGKVGYGASCLDSALRYSKVFTLHALLHDAAGGPG